MAQERSGELPTKYVPSLDR